jgi:hypothetical protein
VEQIERAFQLCYGRSADATERQEALEFVEALGLPALCRVLLNSNEFLFIP